MIVHTPRLEVSIPNGETITRRLRGFYGELGWPVEDLGSPSGLAVRPKEAREAFSYIFSNTLLTQKVYTMDAEGWLNSRYSQGIRLSRPILATGVEVIVNDEAAVTKLHEDFQAKFPRHIVEPMEACQNWGPAFLAADPLNHMMHVRTLQALPML
ncbi:MAG TPA: hypothetical protein VG604_04600 [Candidatus Saccharimonadales bacterium]|nr:hypothetical protein [Candidatus Saccharimonadales bacterium]